MKKNPRYAWIAGLLLLAVTFNSNALEASYLETSRPGEFLQKQVLSKNTLIILDLDDTTITSH